MEALRAVEPVVIKQATKPAQAVGIQSYIIELTHAARHNPTAPLLLFQQRLRDPQKRDPQKTNAHTCNLLKVVLQKLKEQSFTTFRFQDGLTLHFTLRVDDDPRIVCTCNSSSASDQPGSNS